MIFIILSTEKVFTFQYTNLSHSPGCHCCGQGGQEHYKDCPNVAASKVALDLIVTTGNRPGRTTQTGGGLLALVGGLSSCDGRNTGCFLCLTPPWSWVWHPKIWPWDVCQFHSDGWTQRMPWLGCWRELSVLLPIRGAWSPRSRLKRSETSEHSLPIKACCQCYQRLVATLQALE